MYNFREELALKGRLDHEGRLQFHYALTPEEAIERLRVDNAIGYYPLLTSHGDPKDDNMKSIFDVRDYPKADFFKKMNDAVGVDILNSDTIWTSCDFTHGERTPPGEPIEDVTS